MNKNLHRHKIGAQTTFVVVSYPTPQLLFCFVLFLLFVCWLAFYPLVPHTLSCKNITIQLPNPGTRNYHRHIWYAL